MIVPLLVIGIGLESPIVPDPMIVLAFVNGIPEPYIHVSWDIVSLPDPLNVTGSTRATQLLSLSAMVPVLLTVPWANRLDPPFACRLPVLVTLPAVPSSVTFCDWMVPFPA